MCSLHYLKSPELWRYKRPHSPLQGNNTCRVEETQWISACSFLLISLWEGDGQGIRVYFLHRTKEIAASLIYRGCKTQRVRNIFSRQLSYRPLLLLSLGTPHKCNFKKKSDKEVVCSSPVICTKGVGAVCPCRAPGTLADLHTSTVFGRKLQPLCSCSPNGQ